MANQRPFDEFLTQPLQAPRNPAAEAGMGGPFSGIMHAATNFVSGAREARLRQMIEAERQQDKNLRAIGTMLEQLDKGGYDPDDPSVHDLRGKLVAQLATQVAGADDGAKPEQSGGNPLGKFLKQAAVNLLGGQAPKKVAPITADQVLMWQGQMSQLPTMAQAQQKAREGWVEAIRSARTEADEQFAKTGIPAGPEFYQNHPKLVEAALKMQQYGLKPTDLGGAHQSVIGKALMDRDQSNTLARYQDAIKNQRDAAAIEGLRNAPDPGTETFAQFIAQQNPKALQPQGTFVVPASMQTQERKAYYVSPDGKSKEVLVYPNGIAVDAGTGTPIDIAALQAQGWESYGSNPRFSPGSQTQVLFGSDPNNPGTTIPFWVSKTPGTPPQQVPGIAKTSVIATPMTVKDALGGETIQQVPKMRSNLPASVTGRATQAADGEQAPQAAPAQVPQPPGVRPQPAQPANGGTRIDGVDNPFAAAATPQPSTPRPTARGIQKTPPVNVDRIAQQIDLGIMSADDVASQYRNRAENAFNALNQQYPDSKPLTAKQVEDLNSLASAVPLIQNLDTMRAILKDPKQGIFGAKTFGERNVVIGSLEKLKRFVEAKGVATEPDVQRLMMLVPSRSWEAIMPEVNDATLAALKRTVSNILDTTLVGISDAQKNRIIQGRQFGRILTPTSTTSKFEGAKFNAPK